MQEELLELQRSPDGQAVLRGDRAAAERVAGRVGELTDPASPTARMAVGDVGRGLQQSVADSSQRVAQFDQAQMQPLAAQTQQQGREQGAPQGPRLA